MPRRRKRNTAPALRVRLRVYRGDEVALGPGKASLLAAIAETGSLARASRQLGMSYMRAWNLLKTMDRCFREPVVKSLRGGPQGGRAELTRNGREILNLYQAMTEASLQRMLPAWRRISRRLRS
jgi:molybdate transport system regulatory protein